MSTTLNDIVTIKRLTLTLRSVIDALSFSKYPEPKESIASPLLLKRAGAALDSDGN